MTSPVANKPDAQGTSAPKTATDLAAKGVAAIESELRQLLADVFALYVKTKNATGT